MSKQRLLRQVQIQHIVLGTVFNLHYCVPHKSFDFAKKVICENDENRILLQFQYPLSTFQDIKFQKKNKNQKCEGLLRNCKLLQILKVKFFSNTLWLRLGTVTPQLLANLLCCLAFLWAWLAWEAHAQMFIIRSTLFHAFIKNFLAVS